MSGNRLTVLYSFPRPRDRTNPYVTQLVQSIEGDVDPIFFSWRAALTRRYDVFHVHWPEWLLRGRERGADVYKPLLFLLLLLRLRWMSVPIVRTVHNLQAHEPVGWFGRTVERILQNQTVATIHLNAGSATGPTDHVVLHGHYSDWYGDEGADIEPNPMAMAFTGMIRPYKGIETAIRAVRAAEDSELTLTIAGVAAESDYASELEKLADGDPRISFDLRYLSDSEFVRTIRGSSLVVLPYKDMHNSGAMLAALSLERPVLVPRNSATSTIAAEVGSGWVITYDETLEPQDLARALKVARQSLEGAGPDLSARDWERAGQEHIELYRRVRGLG